MGCKVYKLVWCMILLMMSHSVSAQTPAPPPKPPVTPPARPELPAETSIRVDINLDKLDADMKTLSLRLKDLGAQIGKDVSRTVAESLRNLPDLSVLDDIEVKVDTRRHPEKQGVVAEKVKRITKSYSVDSKDKLMINNQFGKVVINTWAKNEIKVDVEIKAYERSDKEAHELLDGVRIEESRSGDLISFKTIIERSSNNGGIQRRDERDDRRGVWVDYVVYMPARNPLDVTNKFGSTSLTDFNGPVKIRSSYGSLSAADLQNKANVVDVRYGSATIGKYEGNINVSYGSLNVDNANQINADVRYGSTRIGKLINGGNLENRYGSLKIDALEGEVRKLDITTDKGSVTMGLKPSMNFGFDVTVHMGGFQYPRERVNITNKTPDDSDHGPQFTKNYKGTYGGNSDSRILIKSSYGSVKFQ